MSITYKPSEKDTVIVATKEDHSAPSTITLPEPEPSPGLILPSGEINWNCPCLGGMATGPCGVQFRDAFSCFHYSEEEPKGKDCYNAFSEMQECMAKYPSLYNKVDDDDSDPMNFEDMEETGKNQSSEISKKDSSGKSDAKT